MKSAWVATKVRKARKRERDEQRRVLFPIHLVDFDTLRNWELLDADSGQDLAIEIHEYFVPKFSGWKELDAFDRSCARLVRDLYDDE
jgi:hypothetical protein